MPVLTPSGWRRIGDIKAGDHVFSRDGNIYDVVGVFPQGGKDSYRVTFDDGSWNACGIDH